MMLCEKVLWTPNRRAAQQIWLRLATCSLVIGLSHQVLGAVQIVSDSPSSITVANGKTQFTVSKTGGKMTSLMLGRQELLGSSATTGYYSANVGDIGASGSVYWSMGESGTTGSYTVGPDFVDVALNYPASSKMPMDVTQHYVLRDGETGFHVYSDIHHTTAMAPKRIDEMRFVLRASPSIFTNQFLREDRYATMPTPAQLAAGTNLQDATDRLPPGTAYEAETGKDVYTKYDWATVVDEVSVYGYYGSNYGAWIVQPNRETLIGGPFKQELTVHQTTTTPVMLGMLVGQHYGTPGVLETVGNYDRSFGPFYVHLTSGGDVSQMYSEANSYFDTSVHQSFYDSLDIPGWVDTADRSHVSGSFHFASGQAAAGAYVILADNNTDFQFSKQGYQYVSHVAADGTFDVSNVRPGTYRMSVYAPGTFGEFHQDDVTVGSGSTLNVGNIAWQPPDHGSDLWQIGAFDRSAGEFRYGANDEYRQYEMWDKYTTDFPDDVDFVIGQSDEATDWNFAHWERATDGHSPVWNIEFEAGDLPDDKIATLTIAIAGQHNANLGVRVNGVTVLNNVNLPYDGNVLARSGARAAYQSQEIQFSSSLLHTGHNTISLLHASPGSNSIKEGIIYDALRLEIDTLLGDYNNDGIVDAADYTVWRNGLGSTYSQVHYDWWKQNFGATLNSGSGGTSIGTVPEPTSLVLLLFGCLAVLPQRKSFRAGH